MVHVAQPARERLVREPVGRGVLTGRPQLGPLRGVFLGGGGRGRGRRAGGFATGAGPGGIAAPELGPAAQPGDQHKEQQCDQKLVNVGGSNSRLRAARSP
ncbi:putative ATP/GTP-binding protein [Streptomyces sp. Tu6071]|nr:putative ATP/GTP-binding protein [Streptomyces sp. Tu6071]